MAFTPTNLKLVSMGSVNCTIAVTNADVVSETDLWTSNIPDIITVWGQDTSTGNVISSASCSLSWTASSGTIHIRRDVSNTGSALTLFILSGLAQNV
jgi:hypothetical protein